MNIKETIRAEIERLKDKISIGLSEYDMGYENGKGEICNDILAFLDTLQQQPVEGLDAEIERYLNRATGFQPKFAVLELTKEDLAKVARHFAEWGSQPRQDPDAVRRTHNK